MFQNAFNLKRRRDKQSEPSTTGGNSSGEITPSTSPKPEEAKARTEVDTPLTLSQLPSFSPPPPPATSSASAPEEVGAGRNEDATDEASIVQGSREIYTPYEKDDEALRYNLDRQSLAELTLATSSEVEPPEITEATEVASERSSSSPSPERTERSSESTVVDPNEGVDHHPGLDGSILSPTSMGMFDTAGGGGIRKSDLWALASELEATQKEKAELKRRVEELMKKVEEAGEKERRVNSGVDGSSKRVEELEALLKEERVKVVQVEEEGEYRLHSLQDKLTEEMERSKVLERDLADAKRIHELVKAELKKELEGIREKLASSEKAARELGSSHHLHSERVEVLQETLSAERAKARENEEASRTRLAGAHAKAEEHLGLLQSKSVEMETLRKELVRVKKTNGDWEGKCDEAAKAQIRLEERVKELEAKSAQLAGECDKKDKENKILLEGVLKPLQTAFGDLRSSLDQLRLDNKDLTSRLEANAAAERERLREEQNVWKRRGGVLGLAMGAAIIILVVSRKSPVSAIGSVPSKTIPFALWA